MTRPRRSSCERGEACRSCASQTASGRGSAGSSSILAGPRSVGGVAGSSARSRSGRSPRKARSFPPGRAHTTVAPPTSTSSSVPSTAVGGGPDAPRAPSLRTPAARRDRRPTRGARQDRQVPTLQRASIARARPRGGTTMNATELLTDELIGAAFERRADRADAYDLGALRTAIVTTSAGTRQRRRWSLRPAGAQPVIAPRPVWVAIAVLAALLGLGHRPRADRTASNDAVRNRAPGLRPRRRCLPRRPGRLEPRGRPPSGRHRLPDRRMVAGRRPPCRRWRIGRRRGRPGHWGRDLHRGHQPCVVARRA